MDRDARTSDLCREHILEDALRIGDPAITDLVTATFHGGPWAPVAEALATLRRDRPSEASLVGTSRIAADAAAAWLLSQRLPHDAEVILAKASLQTVPEWRRAIGGA